MSLARACALLALLAVVVLCALLPFDGIVRDAGDGSSIAYLPPPAAANHTSSIEHAALSVALGHSRGIRQVRYCRRRVGIRVVDSRTGDGIPLVQLRTSHNVVAYTDSLGYIAFFEPGLMNTEPRHRHRRLRYEC